MSHLSDVREVQRLAEGRFGDVWRGEWEGVPVAVKQAKRASREAVDALLREVAVAVSIKAHPNVVTVYGVCHGVDVLVCVRTKTSSLCRRLPATGFVCSTGETVLFFVALGPEAAATVSWTAHMDCASCPTTVTSQLPTPTTTA
jgi:hypothetical protein